MITEIKRGEGEGGGGLDEVDAGVVGGMDDVRVVVACFCEGNGEVLDLVGGSEFYQELDEVD